MELNGRNIFGQKRLDFMFRLACSILGRSDEAQDMMQDVAERILRRQESLEDVRNIDSFLARAVRNACIDRIRRRKETTPKIPDVPDEKNPDRWNDRQMVHRALSKLPERQRLAVHLKDIEGYSNKELADILETDETNVRTILSRGRKALREIIEKEIGYGI
ncbi:MAG: RNA polymerase sigma factor [Bacteroidales bacterium]|nr:RNA polymerase sigma factor [Bacteroidales bacterium]MBO5075772.1 RNA polymerase sigma factor [Bacteroidales bacterium]